MKLFNNIRVKFYFTLLIP